jgi:hypothetical protein
MQITTTIPTAETAAQQKQNVALAEIGKVTKESPINAKNIAATIALIVPKVTSKTTYEFSDAGLLASYNAHVAELQAAVGSTVALPVSGVPVGAAPPPTSLETSCNTELAALKLLDDELLALQGRRTQAVADDAAAVRMIAQLASDLATATNELGGNTAALNMVDALKKHANIDVQRAVNALENSADANILALCNILLNTAPYQTELLALRDSGPAITAMFIALRTSFSAKAFTPAATAATNVDTQKATDLGAAKVILDTAKLDSESAKLATDCADTLKSVDESAFSIVKLTAVITQSFTANAAETLSLLLATAPLSKILSDAAKISLEIEKTTAGAGATHAVAVANILLIEANTAIDQIAFISTIAINEKAIAARALQVLNTALKSTSASKFDPTNVAGAPRRLIDTVVTSLLTTTLQSARSTFLSDDINEVHKILVDPAYSDVDVETIFEDCNGPHTALTKYSKQIDAIAANNAIALMKGLDTYVAAVKTALAGDQGYQHLLATKELERPFIDTLKSPGTIPPGILLLKPSSGDYLGESVWPPLIWATIFNTVYDSVNKSIKGFETFLRKVTTIPWANYKLPHSAPGDLEDLIRWYVLAILFSAQDFDYTVDLAHRASKEIATHGHMSGMIAAYFAGTASSYKAFCDHRLKFEHPALTIARDFVGFGTLSAFKFTPAKALFEGQLPTFADRSKFAGLLAMAAEAMPFPADPPVACLSWEFSDVFTTPPKSAAFYHADYGQYWETVKTGHLAGLTAQFTTLGVPLPDAITGQQLQSDVALKNLESYWIDQSAKFSDVLSLLCLDYALPETSLPEISIGFGVDGCYGVPLTLSGAVKGLTDAALLRYAEYIVALVNFANDFNDLGRAGWHNAAQKTNSMKIIDLYNAFLGVCEACDIFKGAPSKENYEYLVVKHIPLAILIGVMLTHISPAMAATGPAVITAFGNLSAAMALPVAGISPITQLADTSLTNAQSLRVKTRFLAFVNAFNNAVTAVEDTDLTLPNVRTALAVIGADADDLDNNYYRQASSLANAKGSNGVIIKLVTAVQALSTTTYPGDTPVDELLHRKGVFMVEPLLAIEKSLAALETAAADLIPSGIPGVLTPIKFDGEGIDSVTHHAMSGKANYPDDTVRGIGGPCSRFYNAMYGRKSGGALTLYRKFRQAHRLEISTTDSLATKVFTLAWTISNLSFELAARIGEDLNRKASEINTAKNAFTPAAESLRNEVDNDVTYPNNILTDAQRKEFRDKIDAAIAELGNFPALFVSSYIVPVNRFSSGPQTMLSEEQKLINYKTPPTAAFTVAHTASDIPEDTHSDYLVVAKSLKELQDMKFGKGGGQIFGLVVDAIKPGDDVTALYKAAAIELKLNPPPGIKATSANRTKGAKGWLYRIVRYTDSDVHHVEQITYINSSMYAVST